MFKLAVVSLEVLEGVFSVVFSLDGARLAVSSYFPSVC